MIHLSERVITHRKSIHKYSKFNTAQVSQIIKTAKQLKGKKVLHINATGVGGGVAELLESQIALERSLGLRSKWFIINAPPNFFKVTKKIHNLIQGEPGGLNDAEQKIYLNTITKLAQSFEAVCAKEQPDVIVIHDPQPLPLVDYRPLNAKMILRIHVDLSKPNANIIKFLAPYISQYNQVVISSQSFVKALPAIARQHAVVIMPAIDPLSTKNLPMKAQEAHQIIQTLGLDPSKPIISQVSRFDPWKDPVGVIKAYLTARKKIPGLQLVLAGIMNAKDDPQAAEIFMQVSAFAKNDPSILLISNTNQLKGTPVNKMVNAVFTASQIVLQKSLKEGFGLTITEAMFKGKPVIGGNAQGVHLQITDSQNGLIVNNASQAATAIVKLLDNEKLRRKIGNAAIKSVTKQFLLPRYLLQNLKTY